MATPKILVTGATGKTGAPLVALLRERGFPVRAMVRRQDARSARLASLGAEVVVADLFDPDQLHGALEGVQRAYYLPPIHPFMIQSAAAFAVAARTSRLEAIVHLSQWLSHRAHPAPMTRQTWLIDQMFADLPAITHVTINPGMFADNFLRVIDFASLLGMFPILMGESKCASIANEDIARTVATVLEAPDRFSGMTLRPTGPALLSGADMAQIIAKVVGHRVLPTKLPLWMFLKVARQQAADPYEISVFRHYVEDNRNGGFSFDGGVTSVVEDLTGKPAEPFEATARRYAAMPFARQTLVNRLKAMASFAVTPFYPAYNLKKIDDNFGYPTPPNPTYSIQDERWRREHARMMARQPTDLAADQFAVA